ncbi:MAG: hypothetical protein CL908_26255 [Deltaproteobacteria bacterium]|nr:hypothetical protein [Deltaproteobacteria bacterium]
MRSGAFQAGALLAGLTVMLFAALEGANLGKRVGLLEQDPVLVFVIPQPDRQARVRRAVSEKRIVWQGEAGLALVGERVIAASLDDAGDVIEEAGWIEWPIQIVRLDAMEDPTSDDPAARDPASDPARLARLRSLVHKPSLNRAEQMFVLQAMNDGLEI